MHGKANHVFRPTAAVIEKNNQILIEIQEHHGYTLHRFPIPNTTPTMIFGPWPAYDVHDPDSLRISTAVELAQNACLPGYDQLRNALFKEGRIAAQAGGKHVQTGILYNGTELTGTV